MRLLIAIGFVCLFSVGCGSMPQQKYRSHTVQQGETVFSIAKEYEISTEEIYRLNPDARNGIAENSILVIPSSDIINAQQAPLSFKKTNRSLIPCTLV